MRRVVADPAVILAMAVTVAGGAGPAAGAEGEQALIVSGGYGALALPGQDTESGERSLDGGVLRLGWERGLGDTLGIYVDATGGAYDGPTGVASSVALVGGLQYRYDVLRYVPYFHLGGGAVGAFGGGITRKLAPLVELGGGLDVIESRRFAWGLHLAFDAFASEARFLTVTARATWRWGYF